MISATNHNTLYYVLLDPVVSASSRHSSQLITGYAKHFHGEGQDTYFIKDQFSILLYFIKILNVKNIAYLWFTCSKILSLLQRPKIIYIYWSWLQINSIIVSTTKVVCKYSYLEAEEYDLYNFSTYLSIKTGKLIWTSVFMKNEYLPIL